jgi:hypothetical protein
MPRVSIEDSFMEVTMFAQLKQEIFKEKFMTYTAGNKTFNAMPCPTYLLTHIYNKIERRGVKCQNLLSFIRSDTESTGLEWNIHADTNVLGQKPTHAAVLYISEPNEDFPLTGTAFWEHRLYGAYLPSHISDEKYNEMVEVQANIKTQWELRSVIGHKANRLVVYPCNAFHSKYPNQGWGHTFQEGRIVLAMFFAMMDL